MVVGLEVWGGLHGLGSNDSPPDLLIPLLVEPISWIFHSCCHQTSSEGAVSVECGETIAGSFSAPGFSLREVDYSGAGLLCHRRVVLLLRSLCGQYFLDATEAEILCLDSILFAAADGFEDEFKKLVTLCTPSVANNSSRLEQDGEYYIVWSHWQSAQRQVHLQRENWHSPVSIQGQFLGVMLMCNGMESTVLLQVLNMHMVVGVNAPVPHFSDRLDVILCDVLRCFDDVDANEIEAMLGAFGRCCVATMVVVANSGDVVSTKISKFSYDSAIVTKEQDFLKSFGYTMLSLPDGDHAEEAVLLLFGFFHQMWMTTPLLLIPRFNSGSMLRLSSVMVHRYLQLNFPQPQVHMPDRPSGEPPAEHQLVWSTEALRDCRCSLFESELSTDDRWLIGSISNLRFLHVLYHCRPSFTYFV